jgi:anti-sigma factor RsiW
MHYPAGWTCELVVVRLERYLVRTLPRGEALAVAEHIEACVICAQRVALISVGTEAGAGSHDHQRTRRAPMDGAAERRRNTKRKGGDHGR